jgi:starch synthase
MNCLFATSEAYPLLKTGGLADVAGSLPRAMLQLEQDMRVIMPAYQSVMQQLKDYRVVATTHHYGFDIRVLETRLPGSRVKVLLVDCAAMFDRPGNPYLDGQNEPWPDNALRFALFCQVVVDVALNRLAFAWPVDIVHCNDWQCGLVPALLDQFDVRPATLFTIHNLSYQGLFDQQTFIDLGLPGSLWTMYGVEYHGYFSFIKGGLSFADCINTVSPQYALEIQTDALGYGLQDLLIHRADRLSGILNGIDTQVWNPGTDEFLVQKYNRRSLASKLENKLALQQQLSLPTHKNIAMIGMISRLVEQKGLDIILQSLPQLTGLPVQWVFLGTGMEQYEKALIDLSKEYPDSVAVFIGYDEKLSHQIEAACDMYLMPSIFEPCGLNQLYSLRYGTIPLVTEVGGLADSVSDYATGDSTATGFVMQEATASALMSTVKRAMDIYQQPEKWQRLQQTAMQQDHSWKNSASEYLDLYERALSFK